MYILGLYKADLFNEKMILGMPLLIRLLTIHSGKLGSEFYVSLHDQACSLHKDPLETGMAPHFSILA